MGKRFDDRLVHMLSHLTLRKAIALIVGTATALSVGAAILERLVDPVFVGEAMGGGLNFWNDVAWVNLDALPVPMQVGVSTRYWQQAADPEDPRLTIEPDVPVAVEAADYFAGRDPTLEAALGTSRG